MFVQQSRLMIMAREDIHVHIRIRIQDHIQIPIQISRMLTIHWGSRYEPRWYLPSSPCPALLPSRFAARHGCQHNTTAIKPGRCEMPVDNSNNVTLFLFPCDWWLVTVHALCAAIPGPARQPRLGLECDSAII